MHVRARDACSLLAANTTSKSHVVRHDRDTLGVHRAQVRVLEETHEVCFGSLLEGSESCGLEAVFLAREEVDRDLTDETLERELLDQKVRASAVLADLTGRDGCGTVVGFLVDDREVYRLLDCLGVRSKLCAGHFRFEFGLVVKREVRQIEGGLSETKCL